MGYAPQDNSLMEMPGLRELHLEEHADSKDGAMEESRSGLRAETR